MARTKRLSHSNIIRPLCGLIYGEYLTLVLDVTPLLARPLLGGAAATCAAAAAETGETDYITTVRTVRVKSSFRSSCYSAA